MGKYMTDADWSKFKNFKKSEFKCKCKKKYCNEYPSEIAYSLVELLQKCRDHYGKAITITSGLRCKEHNKKVGGVSNSKHMTGQAVDFKFSGINTAEVVKWLKKQTNYNYAYTNSTNMKGCVHIDTKLVSEPVTSNVARDTSKNQVKVVAKELNVRTEPNTKAEKLGTAKTGGIYNYTSVVSDGKYKWYQIANSQYVADDGTYLEVYEKQVEPEPIPEPEPVVVDYEIMYNNLMNYVTTIADSVVDNYEITETGTYEIDLNEGETLYITKKG